METLMETMMKSIWIPGYLKVIHEYLLFLSGSFSGSLFHALMSSPSKINILEKSLLITCINPETGENLILGLDHTIRDSDFIDFTSIRLIYKIETPLEAFLDPKSIHQYKKLSNLIWKFKFYEIKLGKQWKGISEIS
jgi:hypothetical protein